MNLGKIFYILGKYGKINIKKMRECGVDYKFLDKLVKSKILTPINKYDYGVDSVDKLIDYGRQLLYEKHYGDANTMFVCAYETDPTNFNANFQLLYRELIQRRDEIEFKYFDVVYDGLINMGYASEANYYLYLFGTLYNLPEDYRNLFNDIDVDDILLDVDDSDTKYLNEFRRNVFNNSYFKVNGMLADRFDDLYVEDLSPAEKFEKELMLKWLVQSRRLNKDIFACLNTNNIEELRDKLNDADERRCLSISNQYLLKLANQYLTIKSNGIIPPVKGRGVNVFEAIDNNNYELAIQLLERFQDEHSVKDSYLNVMLNMMIHLEKDDKTSLEPLYDAVVDMRNDHENDDDVCELTDKEKQILQSKVESLYQGRSVFLLEPMSKDRRHLICDFVNSKKDVVAFSIGEEPERRVVLRYKPVVEERIDKDEYIRKAKDLYNRGKYEDAAKLYVTLLKIGQPRYSVYGRYGLTLLKLNRKNEALDCLKIATILSKEKGGELDFTNTIESIECAQSKENRKPMVKVKEEEFVSTNKVLIEDEVLNSIIAFVSEGELSLVDACKRLGLSEEDTNYVKLLYARGCYCEGNDIEGDKYFRQVEKSKAKDIKVKELYNDILANKRYYRYRLDEEKKQLIIIKK